MVGEAEIIVRGKVEERASGDLDARALRGIHAAQFAVEPLLANDVEAAAQFLVE